MPTRSEIEEVSGVSFESVLRGAIDFVRCEIASEKLVASAVKDSLAAVGVFDVRIAKFELVLNLLEQMLESETVPFLENLNGTIDCCPRCRH